uniref:Uncharacterized protein n=1 Tax=viral metagenome TaxID=1070528 RepID=A0A6M3KFK0_9ZZZZ
MIESLVAEWLDNKKIDYDYQSEARSDLYGLKADFIVPEYDLVLRITEEEEVQQKAIIENMGYNVVDIREDDAFNLNNIMVDALAGI